MPQADTWGAFWVCLFRQQGKGKFGGRKRCGNCRSCGKTKERFSHSSLNLRFTVPTTPTAAGPSSNTTFLLLPIADELILSFVPDGEQRIWRSLTRMKGAAYARPSTTAEPDGVSAGRNAYQAVDRSQQLTGCQWASHSARFGARRD